MNFDEQPDHYTVPEDYKASEQETIHWEEQQENPGPDGKKPKKLHRGRRIFISTLIILALVLGVAFWLRYCNPYVTDAKEVGYIVKVERRGHIFKTWEGDMILTSALTDTGHTYSRDFAFSVDDPQIALRLQSFQGTGHQVEIRYKSYSGILPWRGSSPNIITSVLPVPSEPSPSSPSPSN